MIVSETHKPVAAFKKLMPGTPIREIADTGVAIPDPAVFSLSSVFSEEPSANMRTILASPKIFTIKYSYLKQLYCTKVLKVVGGFGDPFYKVVLGGGISNNSSLCWLQRQAQGWGMILGYELDENLKQAITSAIEWHEELGLI